MDEAHKELVKRLKRTVYRSDWDDTIVYANPDGVAAADALETLAGEVAFVKAQLAGTNKNIAGWLPARDDATKRAEAAEAERDRLKAALVEQVKQYPDYSDICRKALGDAS